MTYLQCDTPSVLRNKQRRDKQNVNNLFRSLCSVVCKWTYQAGGEDQGWSDDYFRKIGLKDIVQDGYSKIGKYIQISLGTYNYDFFYLPL